MANGLGRAAVVRRFGSDDDGCGWGLARPPERTLVRHDDMHACGLDAAHHLDRARKLALHGAHPGHFLHERSEAERAELIEKLVSHAVAVGQAFFCERHAGHRRLPDGHDDRGAVRAYVKRDAGFLERRTDARDVLAIKSRIEHFGRRAAEVITGQDHNRENAQAHHAQNGEPPCSKREQIIP